MKRNVSVVCICSAPNCCDMEQRSASQPACFLPDAPGSVTSGTHGINFKVFLKVCHPRCVLIQCIKSGYCTQTQPYYYYYYVLTEWHCHSVSVYIETANFSYAQLIIMQLGMSVKGGRKHTFLTSTLDGVEWQLHAKFTLPKVKEIPVTFSYDAVRNPESVWTLWRRETFLAPVWKRTTALRSTVCCLVNISSEMS